MSTKERRINMMKIVKRVAKALFYLIVCMILTVFESVKYVVLGGNLIGRSFIVAGYAGLVASAILKPQIFIGLLIIIGLAELLLAIFISGNKETYNNNKYSNYRNKSNNFNEEQKVAFFDGMSVEDAKREYRRLMKQYHPDNNGGDGEMAQKVSAAFNQYKVIYGK